MKWCGDQGPEWEYCRNTERDGVCTIQMPGLTFEQMTGRDQIWLKYWFCGIIIFSVYQFLFHFYFLHFEVWSLYSASLSASFTSELLLSSYPFFGLRLLMKFMFTNLFGMFCGLCAEAGSLFFFHRCRSNLVFFLSISSHHWMFNVQMIW